MVIALVFISGESGLSLCNFKAIIELKGNSVGLALILFCIVCGSIFFNVRVNV